MKNIFKDKVFRHLFNINLLYANPSYTAKFQKKEKYRNEPKKIYSDILLYNYIIGTIAMVVLYTIIFMPVDFSIVPFLFDYSVLFFLLMNIIQTFTYFFNVFYESKDSESYMPFPIPEKKVFMAKLAVISVATAQLSIPIVSLVILFNFYRGMNLFLAFVFGILAFFIFGGLVVAINMLIMQVLVKSALLTKFKTSIITVISLIGMFLNIFFIIKLQSYYSSISIENVLKGEKVYGPISKIISTIGGQLSLFIVLLAIVIVLIYLIVNKVEKSFYRNIRGVQSRVNDESSATKKNKSSKLGTNGNTKNIKKKSKYGMFQYNMGLIKDYTIITQSIVLPAVMPFMMIVPMIANGSSEFISLIKSNEIMVSILIAMFMGTMIGVYPTNLSSIIISLDRENHNYFKAMPIDTRKYVLSKLLFSELFTIMIPALLLFAFCIYMKINIFSIFLSMLIFVLMTLSISVHWIIYDYNHVITNWHSINDIQNRIPRFISILMFGVLIFMMIIAGIVIATISFLGIGFSSVILGFLVALMILICGLSVFRFNKFLTRLK